MLFQHRLVFKLEKILQIHSILWITLFLNVSGLTAVGSQFVNVPGSVDELTFGTQNAWIYFPENQTGRSSLSVSHNDWYGGFSVASVRISSPLFGGQGLLKFKYGGFENLELRGESPSDDPLSFYSAFGLNITGGFQFHYDEFQTVLLLQMVNLRIHTHSSSGLSGSLSILKPISMDWKMGFSLAHLGFMSPYIDEKPELPSSGNLIINHQTSFNQISNSFLFSGGLVPSLNNFIVSASNNLSWKNVNLSLTSHLTQNVTQISGGISLIMGIYQIQYGFQLGDHQLGIAQAVGLTVLLP